MSAGDQQDRSQLYQQRHRVELLGKGVSATLEYRLVRLISQGGYSSVYLCVLQVSKYRRFALFAYAEGTKRDASFCSAAPWKKFRLRLRLIQLIPHLRICDFWGHIWHGSVVDSRGRRALTGFAVRRAFLLALCATSCQSARPLTATQNAKPSNFSRIWTSISCTFEISPRFRIGIKTLTSLSSFFPRSSF